MDRLWSKIDAEGDCWEWLGSKNPAGYGRFWLNGRLRPAHRVVWEMLVSPVEVNLDIDHLCRNHSCVNPDHLQPVTRSENSKRGIAGTYPGSGRHNALKTHCPKGHEYTQGNTSTRNGRRECKQCNRERAARYRKEKSGEARLVS